MIDRQTTMMMSALVDELKIRGFLQPSDKNGAGAVEMSRAAFGVQLDTEAILDAIKGIDMSKGGPPIVRNVIDLQPVVNAIKGLDPQVNVPPMDVGPLAAAIKAAMEPALKEMAKAMTLIAKALEAIAQAKPPNVTVKVPEQPAPVVNVEAPVVHFKGPAERLKRIVKEIEYDRDRRPSKVVEKEEWLD